MKIRNLFPAAALAIASVTTATPTLLEPAQVSDRNVLDQEFIRSLHQLTSHTISGVHEMTKQLQESPEQRATQISNFIDVYKNPAFYGLWYNLGRIDVVWMHTAGGGVSENCKSNATYHLNELDAALRNDSPRDVMHAAQRVLLVNEACLRDVRRLVEDTRSNLPPEFPELSAQVGAAFERFNKYNDPAPL